MKLPPEAQSAFIVCTFSMLGKMAAADGRVSTPETKRVEAYLDNKLSVDRKTRELALKTYRSAFDSPLELRDYAEKLALSHGDRFELRDSIVEALLEVSLADGVLDPEEERLLRSAALLLGMSPPAFENLRVKVLGAI